MTGRFSTHSQGETDRKSFFLTHHYLKIPPPPGLRRKPRGRALTQRSQKNIFKADFKRQSDPGYYALPQENEQRKGIGDRKKKLGGRSARPPSITAFAVHARDINAMALSPDDRAIDLTSIARVLHLIELKPWCR